MPAAIRVKNLSKRYRIRQGDRAAYRTLRDEIVHAAASPLRWLRGERALPIEEFCALKDVSFEVQPGEVVGVIGRNGAGKSTLLKILSRITPPTGGRVEMRGRVGSLLEVGTGFHPELTGRENVFLSGAILGMRRHEIVKCFDAIVEFAEIQRFLDLPVKRYSSGMYVRLAFSVAAHLALDTLIIDEVLAVGDAAFQSKCLSRLNDTAAEGKCVVFVSHNMTAVRSLCTRALLLGNGALRSDGAPSSVVTCYVEAENSSAPSVKWSDPNKAPGNELVRLLSVRVDNLGTSSGSITTDSAFEITVEYLNQQQQNLNTSVVISNQDNIPVFNSVSPMLPLPPGTVQAKCLVPGNLMNDGTYRLRVLVVRDLATTHFDVHDVVSFQIADATVREGWMGRYIGVIRPQLQWTTQVEHASVAEACI